MEPRPKWTSPIRRLVSPVAANDYLVADTGNNRCVRFNHGGTVLWELTRFNDPYGLSAPGQPLTLSQPASVELRKESFPYTDLASSAPGLVGTMYHYLVSDSDNERIVEVTDTVAANGAVLWSDNQGGFSSKSFSNAVYQDHVLTWVSHTGDQSGRHYRYAGATSLTTQASPGNPATVQIFALVTNTRLAPLVNGQLAPASGDAPGGSIVRFAYPLPPPGPPPYKITSQKPFGDPALTQDLAYVANSFVVGTPATGQLYPVRSPRFLHVNVTPQAVGVNPLPTFLYADDNGAFDLSYTGPNTPPATSYGGFNGLAFTRALYRNMTVPVAGITDQNGTPYNFPRKGLPGVPGSPPFPAVPFVPTCIQRLNNDNTYTPRYLITQSYGQSEVGTLWPGNPSLVPPAPPLQKISGEIFEVDVDNTGVSNAVGGFSGGLSNTGVFSAFTLSRPGGTSPLTQPTFAIRSSQ